jgi:hypothetical protein
MTSESETARGEPLVFSRIFGQTFVVSVRHLGTFLTIAVPPWVVIIALAALLDNIAVGVLMTVVGCVLWALTCSVLTHAAFLLNLGDRVDLTELIRNAISQLPAMLVGFTVAMAAILFAYQFFFVPGIYVSGLFAVILPVAVIERKGMNCISRCEELTRRRRWSTGALWFFISYLIPMVIFFLGVAAFASIAPEAFDKGDFGVEAWTFIIIGFTIYNILTCVLAALIYARLLEIEDGYTRIEEVFA